MADEAAEQGDPVKPLHRRQRTRWTGIEIAEAAWALVGATPAAVLQAVAPTAAHHARRPCVHPPPVSISLHAWQFTGDAAAAKGGSGGKVNAAYAPDVTEPVRWSDQLEALAGPAVPDLPRAGTAPDREAFARTFRDSAGIARNTDLPMLARLLRVNPGPAPTGLTGICERTWWALHTDPASCEREFGAGEGPLAIEVRGEGIEAWTEAELSALHGLTHLAIRSGSRVLAARCLSAVAWHLGEIQPDNGTNRPWAVHAFVLAGRAMPDATMHARTLVHNAIVERGRPERFGAVLLLDAADALRDPGTAVFDQAC